MNTAVLNPPAVRRVLIVDDHPLIRDGIGLLLTSLDEGTHAVFAGSLDEAESLASSGEAPDLIILDLNLPDARGMTGVKRMTARYPGTRIVVFSGSLERQVVRDCVRLGVTGFIPKSLVTAETSEALRQVLRGNVYVPPGLLGAPASRESQERDLEHEREYSDDRSALTGRQLEILDLVAQGFPNKLISRKLSLSGGTVKAHLNAVFQRLGVRNRTAAVMKAQRLGIASSTRDSAERDGDAV